MHKWHHISCAYISNSEYEQETKKSIDKKNMRLLSAFSSDGSISRNRAACSVKKQAINIKIIPSKWNVCGVVFFVHAKWLPLWNQEKNFFTPQNIHSDILLRRFSLLNILPDFYGTKNKRNWPWLKEFTSFFFIFSLITLIPFQLNIRLPISLIRCAAFKSNKNLSMSYFE